jgi:putative Mg2+ transporter-C (MgtC) family protein
MPPTVEWSDLLVRLVLALVAGTALGLNRTERGMTAGLRTTLLVTLAAAISMIQVNLLLGTEGKRPASFSSMDPMRLPLGVLTGMGFIGAGAIIRKGNRISGVTTAATLWIATILGLCFGAGHHGVGILALATTLVILLVLKRLELSLPQEQRGTLTVGTASSGPSDHEIRQVIEAAGARAASFSVIYPGKEKSALRQRISCEVHWKARPDGPQVPPFVRQLLDRPGVHAVRWQSP